MLQHKAAAYIVRGDSLVAFVHENDENPLVDSGLQVHFFHLTTDDAPAHWRHVEDDGGTGFPKPFRLFWLARSKAPLLAAALGVFVAAIDDV